MSGFRPRVAIHPGKSLRRELEYYGVSHKWLAERTGLTEKHISEIANEKCGISIDVAAKFAKVFGGSTNFWYNLDVFYRTTKARLEAEKEAEAETDLLKNFPYQTIEQAGYIEQNPEDTEDYSENAKKVSNLQRFFAVNSLNMVLDSQKMALKKDEGGQSSNPYLVAAWLRKGEIDATKKRSDVEEYDRAKTMDSLSAIRKLVVKDFDSTLEKLEDILGENGIILVITKPLEGVNVKGASRWIGGNPVIQLSDSEEDNDKKWFTLFHEIGHIVLHGRKDRFMEYFDDYRDETDSEKESAADDFAKQQMFLSCIAD